MRSRGFTLIELVLVIVVVAVIAVVAAPRFERDGFDRHAAARELREAIRYAQAMTMAQGGIDTFAVRVDSDGYEVLKNDAATRDPFGNGAAYVQTWSNVAVSPTGKITFGPRGEPLCSDGLTCATAPAVIAIGSGGASVQLRLEPLTGYVR